MSTAALDALYAQVGPFPAPVVPLTQRDRRGEGEDFPTIPVPAAGLELDLNEAAAALFETVADNFAVPVPSTDTLHTALTASVTTLGPVRLAEVAGSFATLDGREFPEVATCRRFAYQLALSFWYDGARSRPMTGGEAGVALYLSSLQRYRRAEFRELPRHTMLLSRALHEGVTSVPTEVLIRLGAVMAGEFSSADRDRGREWLYKQALPDYHRRRFCYDMIRWDHSQPAPLIVRTTDGAHTIGLTPPPGPDGTWPRSAGAQR
ncbi:hypothetical protein [Streptomyces sp. NPDC056672]|uniref:hypothetical protein n=1 Tax=Streptomyces sp. NPDC056672 TaxID=3345906 RepID=UPI00369D7265